MKGELLKYFSKSETVKHSTTTMAFVVAAKKMRRIAKGLPFNCVVLGRGISLDEPFTELDKRGGMRVSAAPPQADELALFLNAISARREVLADGARYQILYKSDDHWSTLDIAYVGGEFSVYMVDPSFTLTCLLDVMALISEAMPLARIYLSGGYQKDRDSCAIFSFDLICCLARFTDVHQQLAAQTIERKVGPFESYRDYILHLFERTPVFRECVLAKPFLKTLGDRDKLSTLGKALGKVNFLNCAAYPRDFAPLMRNIQGASELGKYLEKNPRLMDARVSYRKPCTFAEKIARDFVVVPSLEPLAPPSSRSTAVEKLRVKVNRQTSAFIESLSEDDCAKIISSRMPTTGKASGGLTPPDRGAAGGAGGGGVAEALHASARFFGKEASIVPGRSIAATAATTSKRT
jgi:hypothetical protein